LCVIFWDFSDFYLLQNNENPKSSGKGSKNKGKKNNHASHMTSTFASAFLIIHQMKRNSPIDESSNCIEKYFPHSSIIL
jgi:hypothetical protein